MLTNLQPQPADALLALIKLHNQDPRQDKIDLGVGVYRTDSGATPVFRAVKAAERKLYETQDSKSYLGPEGDMGFVNGLMPYIFGADDPSRGGRIGGVQTPGGTGGVRLAAALAKRAGIARIIMGVPSWPNHAQIFADLDLESVTFAHATADGRADLDALIAALDAAQPGDAVLLHGCCHNPTGIDYTPAQWDAIAARLADGRVLPIIDLAYQGLGQGMEADAYGLRRVISGVSEALVAYSCDKNFGVYRDRVGAFYVMTSDADQQPSALSNAYALARATWSMPPDHGAAVVRLVLEDTGLTGEWLGELDEMRARMRWVRDTLAAEGTIGTVDLAPLAHQNGLFAMLRLTPEQIQRLREEHGIYMAGSGRINIAGLTKNNIGKFVAALRDVAI